MSEGENIGMSSCCLSGTLHEGKPTGRVDNIGGLDTYIAEPKGGSKTKSIIFISDSKPGFLPHTHSIHFASYSTEATGTDRSVQSSAGHSLTPASLPAFILMFLIFMRAIRFQSPFSKTSNLL